MWQAGPSWRARLEEWRHVEGNRLRMEFKQSRGWSVVGTRFDGDVPQIDSGTCGDKPRKFVEVGPVTGPCTEPGGDDGDGVISRRRLITCLVAYAVRGRSHRTSGGDRFNV